ncbi:MAG: 50S ribosome-binding GTPase, partial [Verrucomicrobiae bacterium]|nr:50S ribosome-binding GTPase [Verrucomicrobiae bacterium]
VRRVEAPDTRDSQENDDDLGPGTEFIMVTEEEEAALAEAEGDVEFDESQISGSDIFDQTTSEGGETEEEEESDEVEDIDLIDEDEPHQAEDEGELVADLTQNGERFVLCKGGEGGLGNQHFATPTNQAPIETRPSGKGDEGWFYLELRQIADAGLVGYPNAGKSTLLGALSNAHPKVASYPFTTLQPHVGVVEFPGYLRATVADIPGLIEGAHRNVGLGHEFLRHVTRCRLLLFVVDTAGVDGRDPISDLQSLRTEIKLYDEELSRRPWIIVANKMDLPESQENFAHLQQRFSRQEILPISADTGLGLDQLRERLCELAGRRPD